MSQIPDILRRIIAVKEQEVAALAARVAPGELRARAKAAPPTRGFLRALRQHRDSTGRPALIAEVKKASPSKGVIRPDFDPVWIATRYAAGGAQCLSVLTDAPFFQGDLEFLARIRPTVPLPLLRKDFTIDALQIHEARAHGADAILLIAACLEPARLVDLHAEAVAVGLDVLVEFHDAAEWEAVVAAGLVPPLAGINNRNLRDFTVTLDVTRRLAPAITAAGCFLVAESGIFTPADVAELAACGAGAMLVGESLMRQPDPGLAASALMG
jgi:indole-3-glycerol phosphate synthase